MRFRSDMGRVHHPRELLRRAGALRRLQRRPRGARHHAAVPARLQRARARAGRARDVTHAAHHLRELRGAHARPRAAARRPAR